MFLINPVQKMHHATKKRNTQNKIQTKYIVVTAVVTYDKNQPFISNIKQTHVSVITYHWMSEKTLGHGIYKIFSSKGCSIKD